MPLPFPLSDSMFPDGDVRHGFLHRRSLSSRSVIPFPAYARVFGPPPTHAPPPPPTHPSYPRGVLKVRASASSPIFCEECAISSFAITQCPPQQVFATHLLRWVRQSRYRPNDWRAPIDFRDKFRTPNFQVSPSRSRGLGRSQSVRPRQDDPARQERRQPPAPDDRVSYRQ